jgi:parallel beta-helix repeat protein
MQVKNKSGILRILPVSLVLAILASFVGAGTPVSADTSSTRLPGTGANIMGAGTICWNSFGNITAADSSYAHAIDIPIEGGTTNYLCGSNFGFTIPPNATINGITVEINHASSGDVITAPVLKDSVVSLVKGGVIQSTNKASTEEWPYYPAAATTAYGGPTDLWGTTWTSEDINASNFGIVLAAVNTNTVPGRTFTAWVDFMRITVNYTPDTTSPTVTVTKVAGQDPSTSISPVNFTAVFSEPVIDFTSADITLTGTAGATTATMTEVSPNNDTTYNIAVSGMPLSGTVTAYVAAGVAHDAAVNTNIATSTAEPDRTVNYTRTFVITSSTGAHGTISPLGATVVNYGASQSYTITPDTANHYHVADVLVDGTSVLSSLVNDPGNPLIKHYTFTNVVASHTIIASFTIDTNNITATAGVGGSITPSGTVPVNYDASQVFTINPFTPGYHIANVLVNGGSIGAVGSYTFTHVTAPQTISATFAKDTFTVNAFVTEGHGTATPGTQTIQYGDSATITVTPESGYHVYTVTDNGSPVPITYPFTSYVIQSVTSNHDVYVTFSNESYAVTATVTGGHGTATPANQTVAWGGNATITIDADSGYHINTLTDNSNPVTIPAGDPETYTIANVSESHSVEVIFATEGLTLAINAINGTVTRNPDQTLYDPDSSVELAAIPSAGYRFDHWSADASGSTNPVTVNMEADKTVTANFVFSGPNSTPKTWTVDDDGLDFPGADFSHPQDAVNAARPGDTIIVYPGTYGTRINPDPPTTSDGDTQAPPLIVYKDNLTISSSDPGNPDTVASTIIQTTQTVFSNPTAIQWSTDNGVNPGTTTAPNSIAVISSGINIDGLTIKSPPVPGSATSAGDVMIGGLYLGFGGSGEALGFNNNTVQNCSFPISTAAHIFIWHSSSNSIKNNSLMGQRGFDRSVRIYDGNTAGQINLGYPSRNNLIQSNTMSSSYIIVGGKDSPIPTDNSGTKIINNILSLSEISIFCSISSGIEIYGNTFTGSVMIYNSISIGGKGGKYTSCVVKNNTISGAEYGVGISLSSVSGSIISDNYISGPGKGRCIDISNSDDIQITGNTIRGSNQGLNLSGTSNLIVAENIIINNNYSVQLLKPLGGLIISSGSSHISVTNNTINNNNAGIVIDAAAGSGNTISFNNIINNYDRMMPSNRWNILNNSGTLVDAENNWWGDLSGPYNATSNPGGLGNDASDNVDFSPWISRIELNTQPQPSNSVDLQAILYDSNDVSVPVGAIIYFQLNSELKGTAATDSNGIATLNIGAMPLGTYSVRASLGPNCIPTEGQIEVVSSNHSPVASAQSISTGEDTPAAVGLVAIDQDHDPLTYSIVDAPLHGALSGTAPHLIYTPNSSFHGRDSFTFKANDGKADSNIARVSITIQVIGPSQYWYLDVTGHPIMEKTGTQSGSVDIPAKVNGWDGYQLWVSDLPAEGEMPFPIGNWSINLATSDWADFCSAQVGEYYESNFVPFNSIPVKGKFQDGFITITINTAGTVYDQHYLALIIYNSDDSLMHTVITDHSSYLSSPDYSYVAPLPEWPPVALMGIGLAGLTGFIILKRRKAKSEQGKLQ